MEESIGIRRGRWAMGTRLDCEGGDWRMRREASKGMRETGNGRGTTNEKMAMAVQRRGGHSHNLCSNSSCGDLLS